MNKIRECPQHAHILVTHTDAKELYVWDIEKQPNRAADKVRVLMRLGLASLLGIHGIATDCHA